MVRMSDSQNEQNKENKAKYGLGVFLLGEFLNSPTTPRSMAAFKNFKVAFKASPESVAAQKFLSHYVDTYTLDMSSAIGDFVNGPDFVKFSKPIQKEIVGKIIKPGVENGFNKVTDISTDYYSGVLRAQKLGGKAVPGIIDADRLDRSIVSLEKRVLGENFSSAQLYSKGAFQNIAKSGKIETEKSTADYLRKHRIETIAERVLVHANDPCSYCSELSGTDFDIYKQGEHFLNFHDHCRCFVRVKFKRA